MAGIINERRCSNESISNNLGEATLKCTRSYQGIKASLTNYDDDEKDTLLDSLKEHESALENIIKICQKAKEETKDMRLEVFKSKHVQTRTERGRPRDSGYTSADAAFIRESEARQPIADTEECGRSVQETAPPPGLSVVHSDDSSSEC